MSTHANLSPSKRHRWALCPGSIREEAKYPDDTSGPAAIDGTHSHTLLEHCIDAGLIDPTTQVGEVMADDDGEFKVDADRAARVKTAIEYICERSLGGMLKVISEERVDPKHLLGRDDLSGTVDCQIIGPDWIELIDYKDGMGVVEAEGNMQLEQYAYGVLAGYKAEDGMTLRDYFAAKAMQAAFAEMLREKPCEGAAAAIRVSAVIAYQMADAMLKARGQ